MRLQKKASLASFVALFLWSSHYVSSDHFQSPQVRYFVYTTEIFIYLSIHFYDTVICRIFFFLQY